jgi:UDP-4-amino-4,6-dideoxy-N-acetyl-beta-L-altrosamine N-acetyltransferase
MIVSRYGVKLIKLEQQHIELLRTWRNAEKISRFMEFREHITPEMQQRWFEGLNQEADFYFMIEYRGSLVGMIHASGIDWKQGRGDAGLFIYEDRYLSTYTPVLASLCMVDLFFGVFTLERLYAKVMRNNPVAEAYNSNLGFKHKPMQEEHDFQMFELTRDNYFAATDNLRKKAISVEGNHFTLQLSDGGNQLLNKLGVLRAVADFEINIEHV